MRHVTSVKIHHFLKLQNKIEKLREQMSEVMRKPYWYRPNTVASRKWERLKKKADRFRIEQQRLMNMS